MTTIESSGLPLVFKVTLPEGAAVSEPGERPVEVIARCLAGMEKEALVAAGGSAAWRMVSDQRSIPYQNGQSPELGQNHFESPGHRCHAG